MQHTRALRHIFLFFLRSTFVSSGWSFVFSSPPQRPMTSDFQDFYTRFYPLHYFPIFILEKEPVFPFLMFSAKQGNSCTIFITCLVWRGPWLGIEPGTSRTWSQHSTTRLSRRRYSPFHMLKLKVSVFFGQWWQDHLKGSDENVQLNVWDIHV